MGKCIEGWTLMTVSPLKISVRNANRSQTSKTSRRSLFTLRCFLLHCSDISEASVRWHIPTVWTLKSDFQTRWKTRSLLAVTSGKVKVKIKNNSPQERERGGAEERHKKLRLLRKEDTNLPAAAAIYSSCLGGGGSSGSSGGGSSGSSSSLNIDI